MKLIKTINTISVMLVIAFMIWVAVAALTPENPQEWQYTRMGAQINYAIGQRVTSAGKVYECKYWDEGSPLVVFPPAANPDWWAEVQ